MSDHQAVCPICASGNTVLHRDDIEDFEYSVKTARRFTDYLCRGCGSEFLFPRPGNDEISSFYPDDYHAYHDDHGFVARHLVGLRSRKRVDYYKKLTRNAGKASIFDVGAGDCRHFDALAAYCDFEFTGVEIKPEIARKARARGYDITEGTLEDMDITAHVARHDIVSMNHVIEHVAEPRKMAQRCFEILKPGGYAIGQLPSNSSWEARLFGRCWGGYHFPRHLQCFSRAGLKKIFEDAGFVDVKVLAAPHLQTALSLQNTLMSLGWKPRLQFGKSPVYSLLLLAAAPFELLAYLFNSTGIVNIEARKPDTAEGRR